MAAEIVTNIPQCRFCRCTEGGPCSLTGGDTCILNVVTLVCSRPGCLIAAALEQKRLKREQKSEVRKAVGVLIEGWREGRKRRATKKNRKFSRRTA